MSDSTLPFEVTDDPFEKSIRGVYGRFQTKDSYRLNYLLTSVPFADIDQLDTAAHAISIADPEVTFAQLLQRDIDYKRVHDIATDYLEKGAHRVLFFPPLLVSPLGIRNGNIVKKYESNNATFEDGLYRQTWQSGFFQLLLPLAKENTGQTVTVDGDTRFFYSFGARLRYNPRLTKLIVIDGQHRLQALKRLKGSAIVETIDIPICIVFSPGAVTGSPEELTADLRELFVRINQEAEKVSGHFITLLNDKSLSAETVRNLADYWKGQLAPSGYTPLQLLEWNQREARLANQVTRSVATTTVSIIANVLANFLFKAENNVLPPLFNILNLQEIKTQLEKPEGAPGAESIRDDDFHPEQLSLLRTQLEKYIVPALDHLFRMPRPYAAHELSVRKAYEWLDEQIAGGSNAAAAFKADVLQQFRDVVEIDSATVKDFQDVFDAQLDLDESDKRFFYNVFQQGLLRCWVTVAMEMLTFEISPVDTAIALCESLDTLCFRKDAKVFGTEQLYARRVLFTGERVLLSARARDSWSDLITATLANAKSGESFVSKIKATHPQFDNETLDRVTAALRGLAINAARDYLNRFRRIVGDDFEANFIDRDLPEAKIQDLSRLSRSEEPQDRKAFEDAISEMAEERRSQALTILSNVLKVSKKDLSAHGQ